MSQNSDCSCSSFSKLTANTGINQVTTADTSVLGNGAGIVSVITGASKGTIVRSVIIKAMQVVNMGMVRLFVTGGGTTSLYKEVPVPVTPSLNATPTPAPILPTFEVDLEGGLVLQSGYILRATTVTGQTFNIIAEGLDRTYKDPLPAICCNFKQETALNDSTILDTANTNLNGTGAVTIFTAPGSTNGSRIKSITIKALQGTNEGMVRIFVGVDDASFRLIKEVSIPPTNPGNFDPFFKHVIDMDFNLQADYVLGATTQLSEGFAITVEAESWEYVYA